MNTRVHQRQSIQLRHDDFDEDYISEEAEEEDVHEDEVVTTETEEASEEDDNGASEESQVDGDSDDDQHSDRALSEDRSESEESEEQEEDLKDISFGALAKAQASFAPPSRSRKRKHSEIQTATTTDPKIGKTAESQKDAIDNAHPTQDFLAKKPKQEPLQHRTSKHAPIVLSSRNPVSRKREIIAAPPPASKSRDPRFDPTITSRTLNPSSQLQASKAYSFLTDYQASEILQLKSELKSLTSSASSNSNSKSKSKSKSKQSLTPDQITTRTESIKRQLQSLSARVQSSQHHTREREILHAHKQQERQAIRDGRKSKPYYLKKSELKSQVEKERLDAMGKRQRDKMEKRKRMRQKTKEARDMPWARRMG